MLTPVNDRSPKDQDNQEQGSVETAIAGQYDFDIAEVISEAWQRTDGVKMPFNIALSIYSVVYILAVLVVPYVLSGFSMEFTNISNAIGGLLNLLVGYPVMAGVMMMGVTRASGRTVDYGMCLQFFSKTLPIFLLMVVMFVMVMLGFVLLIIPGIYLAIAYMFAMLLVLEKNMGTWEALETSRQAVTHHWFKLFGVGFVMGLIMFISMLPLGIGLIWTMPMFYILNGVLYRRIFGVDEENLPGTSSSADQLLV